MTTGRRAWRSELSTIDTAILIAGALTAAAYFDRATKIRIRASRSLADALYRRVDWRWAQNGTKRHCHTGGSRRRDSCAIAGADTTRRSCSTCWVFNSRRTRYRPEVTPTWTSTYRWKRIYGYELLYGGPLFMHQLSHLWLDLRGIQDAFMRRKGIDYFPNRSRRAVYVSREYTIRNPKGFSQFYGEEGGASPRATDPVRPHAG